MKSYRELIVWQKGVDLSVRIYDATKSFPQEEAFGMTSQIRRSAISIPSNIAEGYGRSSQADFARFLKIASGSLYELQTQLEISKKIKYITSEQFDNIWNLSIEIGKMLSSLISKIQKSSS